MKLNLLYFIVLFCALIMCHSAGFSAQKQNLLEDYNPDFEIIKDSVVSNWNKKWGSVVPDSNEKMSGNNSIKIQQQGYLESEKLIPVELGYSYCMSVNGKVQNFKFVGSKYGCGFGLHELRDDMSVNGNWYGMQTYLKYYEGDKDWEYVESSPLIPKETTKYLLPVIHVEALPGSLAWYDDVRVWKEPIKEKSSQRLIDITENGSFEVRYDGGKMPFAYFFTTPADFKGSVFDRVETVGSIAYDRGASLAVKGESLVESGMSAFNSNRAHIKLVCKLEKVEGEGVYAKVQFLNSKRETVQTVEICSNLGGSGDWKIFESDVEDIDPNVCYARWVLGMKPFTTGVAYFDTLQILVPTTYQGLPKKEKDIEKCTVTVDCTNPIGIFNSPLNSYDHHCADRVHSWSIGTAGTHLEGSERWYQMQGKLGVRYVRVHSGYNGNYLCQNIPYDPRYAYYNVNDDNTGISFHALRTNYPEGDSIFPPVCRIDTKTGEMITDFSSIKHYLDNGILKGGMKPIFGLEPVPEAIALENNSHYKPKDMKLWEEFNYRFIKFLIENYGKEEVLTWIFETANEPGTEPCFHGSLGRGDVLQDFLEMQDYTVAGCTRALPDIFIAGPSGPPESFFVPMLEHCAKGTNYATGKIGTKIDAVSYHGYLGGTATDLSWRQAEDQILRMHGYIDMYFNLTGKRLQLFNTEWTPIYHELTNLPDFNMHASEDNRQAVGAMHVAYFSRKLGVDMLTFFYFAPFYSAPIRGDYPAYSAPISGDSNLKLNQANCPEFFGKETMISFHGIFKPVCRSFEMLSWLNGMTEIAADSQTDPIYSIAAMDSNSVKVLCYSFDVDPQVKYTTNVNISINLNDMGKSFQVAKYELSATKANSAYLCQTQKITQENCEKNVKLVDKINMESRLVREDLGRYEAFDGKLNLSCPMSAFSAVLFVIEKAK